MIRCPQCGKDSNVGSSFCASCGTNITNLSISCPKCKKTIAASCEFCPECGCNVEIEKELAPARRHAKIDNVVDTTFEVGKKVVVPTLKVAGCLVAGIIIFVIIAFLILISSIKH